MKYKHSFKLTKIIPNSLRSFVTRKSFLPVLLVSLRHKIALHMTDGSLGPLFIGFNSMNALYGLSEIKYFTLNWKKNKDIVSFFN